MKKNSLYQTFDTGYFHSLPDEGFRRFTIKEGHFKTETAFLIVESN
ncbi:hypothetical protein L3C95_16860 [Chitinophaga filiformis]|nr:hypothetical protein [Chitinophaga filiformis]MCF6404570.1 hypothetical protein [Chitinophaga filiformis]